MSVAVTSIRHGYRAGPLVLDEVNVDVPAGRSVAITGPSGSGKSTLLSIMGLTLRPTSGDVVIDGVDALGPAAAAARRRIAWILQGTPLLAHRSVADNVMLGGLSRGASRHDLIAETSVALSRVGLSGHERHRAATLSGGEAQRLGVARALLATPSVVLADEPTAQLDRRHANDIGAILTEIVLTGAALVVATHDLSLASSCDEEYLLLDGRLDRVR